MPLYTIIPSCRETGQIFNDGTTKIIANSTAAEHAENELKAFLSYMNGKLPETAFTKQLDRRVTETKGDEEKRREYMLLKSFEMDVRRAGIAEGIQQGIRQGISQGAYQNKLETAKNLTEMGFAIEAISKATGLSLEEIAHL